MFYPTTNIERTPMFLFKLLLIFGRLIINLMEASYRLVININVYLMTNNTLVFLLRV